LKKNATTLFFLSWYLTLFISIIEKKFYKHGKAYLTLLLLCRRQITSDTILHRNVIHEDKLFFNREIRRLLVTATINIKWRFFMLYQSDPGRPGSTTQDTPTFPYWERFGNNNNNNNNNNSNNRFV